MLVLFDIDMTMITTSRAGMAAMTDAGRELFGDDFNTDWLEFAGRLDPLLVMDIHRSRGHEHTAEGEARFRSLYAKHLGVRLLEKAASCRALPGVIDLLHAVKGDPRLVLGVLTGNWAETGSMKLKACGIDPAWFRVSVWGDESESVPPTRDDLPRVAMKRWGGTPPLGVIVGDTPHDVRCAKVNGLRALAVATGKFPVEELRASGADLVVTDLSDTREVMAWLTEPIRSGNE